MSAPLAESATECGCTVSWMVAAHGGPIRHDGWWCAARGNTVVERHTTVTMAEAKRLALEWLEEECMAQATRAIAAAQRVKARRVALDAPGQTVVRSTANEEDMAP